MAYTVDGYTVSLLHFDDGIKDEAGKVWTAQNGTAVSTTQSKFGGSSLYLNGSNQYLTTPNSIDFDFGVGDFTIDWWEYITNSAFNNAVVLCRDNSQYPGVSVGWHYDGNVVICMSSTGSSWDIAYRLSMGTYDLNKWNHYALVRSGNTFYTFKNGNIVNTFTSSATIKAGTTELLLGSWLGKDNNLGGYIDEFRISKGIARWTGDFDPENPPDIESGKLLLTVTLDEEVEREYALTKEQVDDFVAWYDAKTGGTYTFDKSFNRKDYLVFDKIITFEVTDFTK